MRCKIRRWIAYARSLQKILRRQSSATNHSCGTRTILMAYQSKKQRIAHAQTKTILQLINKCKTWRSKRWTLHPIKSCRHWSVSKSNKCVMKMNSTHEASSRSRKTETITTIIKAHNFRMRKQQACFSMAITTRATTTCLVTTEILSSSPISVQCVTRKTTETRSTLMSCMSCLGLMTKVINRSLTLS